MELSSSNRNSARARASSVLPYPGRSQEDEGADRAVGILQAGPRPANGIRHHPKGIILADHALVQPLLHMDQLLCLALQQARDRDARPARHDLGDLLGVDFLFQQRWSSWSLFEALFTLGQFGFQLAQRAP
jgi:hypothetical protein